MKLSPQTRSFCLVLVLTMAFCTVASAFAMVWTQQQITRTAQHTKQIEVDLAETIRRIGFVDERIAAQHQPVVLQGKFAGILRPSMENQVVWVREQVSSNGRVYAVDAPYQVSIDLAMLQRESTR